jgi:hypothetical protein
MSFEELGSIGEFIAAIATLATLIYLAIQLRQNTNASRAQSRQTLLDQWSASNWDLSKDPNLLRIYANAIANWPDIPNEEKMMFDTGMGRYLANIQNGVLLRDAGMLDENTVDMVAGYMLMCIRSSGGSRWWKDTANALPETREYIDHRLAHDDNPEATTENLAPHWIAMADNQAGEG